jgi:glycosyltransferase involved in cell wall biosynthesis
LRVSLPTSARTWRGSTVSLSHIASGLARRGHHAELLVGEEELGELARHRGIPVTVLPTGNTGLTEVRALRRALGASRSEVIIADRPRDLRLGAMAAFGKGMSLLYRYNVSRPRPPSDVITRLSYLRVAATVFRSSAGAEQVLRAAPFMARRPHRVITGGVDTSLFYPDPTGGERFREIHHLAGDPFLLAVGALMPEKRYPAMFDIVSRMARPIPLLVCGAGRLEPELRDLASRLGIEVRFLGLIPPPELRAAFAAATLVLHTCRVETFGLSVAEAMACGRTVVAAEGGAMNEVVHDAGILVAGDDPQTFAGRLALALDDPVLRARLGAAAHARSIARFSVDRVIAEYDRLLQDLATG